MVIAVVIGAGLVVWVAVVGHVRLGGIVERATGVRLTWLARVKELHAATVRMVSAVVLRLLLVGMDSSAHHGRAVGVRHAAKEGRSRRELVDQLENGSILLLRLVLLLALEFFRIVQILLLHRGHFRRGKWAQTIGRMDRGAFWMAFHVHLGDNRIRFGTALRRRVWRLDASVAQIVPMLLEPEAVVGRARLAAV